MKVVVTGASGSVGSALRRAVPDDWEVVGIARRVPSGNPDWVACDLGADDAPTRLTPVFDGVDAVVHLAWGISPSPDDPEQRRTNLAGSAHVLRAALDAGVPHVVCASSVAAYTPAPRDLRVDEDWPRDGVPASAYSRQKAEFERMLDAVEPAVALARIRPCAVVNPDAGGELDRWVRPPFVPPGLIGDRRLPVPLWKRLRAQVVHADDVADALVRIVDRRATGAFNLASEPVLDSRTLAKALGGVLLPVPLPVLRALAWPTWRIGLQPMHPGWLALADRASLVDTRRARDQLEWRPRHDALNALVEFVEAVSRGQGTWGALEPRRRAPWWSTLGRGRPMRQSQAEETT